MGSDTTRRPADSAGAGESTTAISAREADVLVGILDHLSNAEIADRLFISVRTVESHVSSMLRKFGVSDRRSLAQLAPWWLRSERAGPGGGIGPGPLPLSLTPFVGRTRELGRLEQALTRHRLVSAVGPGGVGKTRLALQLGASLRPRYADGVAFVDLVPVAGARLVPIAVLDAFGLGEQRGRTAEQILIGYLSRLSLLLVLDNCEHVRAGVVPMVERLLSRCPELHVLATSRWRLLLPYEHVFAVPGLSIAGSEPDRAGGDAVQLFCERALAAGVPSSSLDPVRVAELCRRLDGMALAIELAAARLPGLGLDGLDAGLADRLELLTGGPRVGERHRSLRATLDWSWALLGRAEQALLLRTFVFATPFSATEAALLDDEPPDQHQHDPSITIQLADLVEHSLVEALATPGGPTRYRMLETIRQYAAELCSETGEETAVRERHATWCLQAARLLVEQQRRSTEWSQAADRMIDELRAALAWAEQHPAAEQAADDQCYRLAEGLARLLFLSGRPAGAQSRFEQAAAATTDLARRARALRSAAGAAETRHFGDEALRLFRAAAAAAESCGETLAAAEHLARWAQLVGRGPGLITDPPDAAEIELTLRRAVELTGSDTTAGAAVALARAYVRPVQEPATLTMADRALGLAVRSGDQVTECAALDLLMALYLSRGQLGLAVETTLRRAQVLEVLPISADIGIEFSDGFNMATDGAVGVGDLVAARRFAVRVAELPFYSQEWHIAAGRLIVVTALSGDWETTSRLAVRFRRGWELAGRPTDGDLNRSVYAAATVAGLRGDEGGRAEFLSMVEEMMTPALSERDRRCYQTFDAMLALQRGRPEDALEALSLPPEELHSWHDGLWRPWHVALWAEASVLSGHLDAEQRLRRAEALVVDNRIAVALVRRAAALRSQDRAAAAATIAVFDRAGCPYQSERTRILLG